MRRSPWGDLEVADAHVHFFSHKFFSALAKQKGEGDAGSVTGLLGWEAPDQDPTRLAERWIQELDRHSVDHAVLIASVPGDESSVAAAVSAYPARFHGYFMWNPLAPGSLDQIKPALESGMQGVCLFPAMHRYSMHDDRVQQMLALLAANPGSIVFVHCGVLTVGVRRKLGLPSQFDMRYSNPIDVHASALAFPKLPLVIPHFGAGYFREALMVADLCPNIYLDTSSTNSWMKYEGLTLRSAFERALVVLGPQRLLFGSDSSFFPRGWVVDVFETQAAVLNELRVPQGDAAGIFGGNLGRLLNRTNPS